MMPLTTTITHAISKIVIAQPVDSSEAVSVLTPYLNIVVEIGIVTLIIGIMLALYRMLRGPHLADRVLSGDTISYHVVGLVILLTIRMGVSTYFDGALVVAMIGFASTLAFSQYIANQQRMPKS